MTEQEWLGSNDWRRFLTALGDRATDRKLRLLAVAVCRRIAPALLYGPALRALVVAEKLSDGVAGDEVSATRQRLGESGAGPFTPIGDANSACWHCLARHKPAQYVIRDAIATAWRTSQPPRDIAWANDTVALLRDIFGNPFRPVAFDPSWQTDAVVSAARQMYESRDFGAMPILADALQDAGCEHPDILDHCRSEGPHVRGCWVVDLVLGKS